MAETFSAEDKCRAAAREVVQRQRVYPRLVEAGKMTQVEATRQTAIMSAIAADYRKLADEEAAKGRLL
jgi:hypothetical protein